MKLKFWHKTDRSEEYFWWATAMAGILVFIIALFFSLGKSTWFDEGYSILLAQHSVGDLIALTAVDAHPPFYYLLLKFVGEISGWNELALRGLSAVAGAASVVVMALILRKLFTAKVALGALPFLIFAPFLLRYDYEIRMYALVTLLGALATYVLIHAWESKKTWQWVLYGLLVLLGMYTLYMSVVIWLAHFVWLTYMTVKSKRPLLKQKWVLSYAGAIVLFLPWVPTLIHQLINSALPGVMYPVTLQQLLGVVSLITNYVPDWQISAWLSVGLLAFGILFGVVYTKVWKAASQARRQSILLLTLCFVVPLVFYIAISLPPLSPKFIPRYVAHIAIFAYALIGMTVVLGYLTKARHAAFALGGISLLLLVVGVANLFMAGNFINERYQKPQTKVVLQELYGCDGSTFISSGAFGYIDQWYDLRECDTKFYQPTNPSFAGGYAPLHDSDKRITSTNDITSERIVFVYYEDSTDFIKVDDRYTLTSKRVFDKTHVDIYEKIP